MLVFELELGLVAVEMEDALAQLSLTNVQLAISQEESISLTAELRHLHAENCRMTIMVERLISEKRQMAHDLSSLTRTPHTDSKTLSPSDTAAKPDKAQLDTESESPRFRLLTEVSDEDETLLRKCAKALTRWDKNKTSAKLRKLVAAGFSRRLRGELWEKAIGNLLRLPPAALSTLQLLAKVNPGEEYTAVNLIPLDLRRTLTYLQAFQEDQPLHQPLKSLLTAFAVSTTQELRPDIGYVQGMAYLGAVFLLHLPPPQAFVCFANAFIKSQLLFDFYSFDIARIARYYRVIETLGRECIPAVMEKLRALTITPEMYLLGWVYTLFVRCVDIEHVGQVWDYIFTEGDVAYCKLAVGILMRMQDAILSSDLEEISRVFDMVPYLVGDVRELLKCAQKVSLSDSALRSCIAS